MHNPSTSKLSSFLYTMFQTYYRDDAVCMLKQSNLDRFDDYNKIQDVVDFTLDHKEDPVLVCLIGWEFGLNSEDLSYAKTLGQDLYDVVLIEVMKAIKMDSAEYIKLASGIEWNASSKITLFIMLLNNAYRSKNLVKARLNKAFDSLLYIQRLSRSRLYTTDSIKGNYHCFDIEIPKSKSYAYFGLKDGRVDNFLIDTNNKNLIDVDYILSTRIGFSQGDAEADFTAVKFYEEIKVEEPPNAWNNDPTSINAIYNSYNYTRSSYNDDYQQRQYSNQIQMIMNGNNSLNAVALMLAFDFPDTAIEAIKVQLDRLKPDVNYNEIQIEYMFNCAVNDRYIPSVVFEERLTSYENITKAIAKDAMALYGDHDEEPPF